MNESKSNVAEQRAKFESWLSEMDSAIEWWIGHLPKEVGDRLDFSPASLDALEAWLLSRYRNYKELQAPGELAVYDGTARYIGQTFLTALGGYWDLRLNDPKYVYCGLPQITGFGERPTPECPHTIATAAIARREGNYIRSILNAIARETGRAARGT